MTIYVSTAIALVSLILNTFSGRCEGVSDSKPPHSDKGVSDFLVVKNLFIKSFELYDQALPFATNSAVKTSDIVKSDEGNFVAAVMGNSVRILNVVREKVKNKMPLDDSRKDFLKMADAELGRGLAEWTKRNLTNSLVVGAQIGESVKNGGRDEINSLGPGILLKMGVAFEGLALTGSLTKLYSETKTLCNLR